VICSKLAPENQISGRYRLFSPRVILDIGPDVRLGHGLFAEGGYNFAAMLPAEVINLGGSMPQGILEGHSNKIFFCRRHPGIHLSIKPVPGHSRSNSTLLGQPANEIKGAMEITIATLSIWQQLKIPRSKTCRRAQVESLRGMFCLTAVLRSHSKKFYLF